MAAPSPFRLTPPTPVRGRTCGGHRLCGRHIARRAMRWISLRLWRGHRPDAARPPARLPRQAAARGRSGKSFDLSAPCGAIHPAGVAAIRRGGAITSRVNGAERQRGDLAQMIWSTSRDHLEFFGASTLEPGDLIMTGTPAGVGPVWPGDCIDRAHRRVCRRSRSPSAR